MIVLVSRKRAPGHCTLYKEAVGNTYDIKIAVYTIVCHLSAVQTKTALGGQLLGVKNYPQLLTLVDHRS